MELDLIEAGGALTIDRFEPGCAAVFGGEENGGHGACAVVEVAGDEEFAADAVDMCEVEVDGAGSVGGASHAEGLDVIFGAGVGEGDGSAGVF